MPLRETTRGKAGSLVEDSRVLGQMRPGQSSVGLVEFGQIGSNQVRNGLEQGPRFRHCAPLTSDQILKGLAMERPGHPFFFSKAASNATLLGGKSSRRTKAAASVPP